MGSRKRGLQSNKAQERPEREKRQALEKVASCLGLNSTRNVLLYLGMPEKDLISVAQQSAQRR